LGEGQERGTEKERGAITKKVRQTKSQIKVEVSSQGTGLRHLNSKGKIKGMRVEPSTEKIAGGVSNSNEIERGGAGLFP